MILYLDTTALVKLYLDELGRDVVLRATTEASSVATSVIAYAEARAAFARRLGEGDLTEHEHAQAVVGLDRDWEGYGRIEVVDGLARLAGALAHRFGLRGFDAIHLASALQISQEISDARFLAFDKRLMAAAGHLIPLYGQT